MPLYVNLHCLKALAAGGNFKFLKQAVEQYKTFLCAKLWKAMTTAAILIHKR